MTVTVKEDTATGSLARQMTDTALREKFDALCDTVARRSMPSQIGRAHV